VAALGTCFGILMHHEANSWESYLLSLGFTFIGAGIFTLTRTKSHRVPQEALIGIVYVVTAALGILLLSRSPEGNEELRRTLIGEVLLVTPAEVLRTFALYVVIAIIHWFCRKKFLAISFEPDRTLAEGMPVRWWDFVFYAMFGWVVTSFVQIGGVLLVFSYLIVPAVCANFLADALGAKLLIGWATATVASGAGLYASYVLDLPTGAAIVCALGLALIFSLLAATIRRGPAG
jgi:zinc/manganese transport system permease protein